MTVSEQHQALRALRAAVGLQVVGGCVTCYPPPNVSTWAAGALCLQTAISATGPCGRNAPQEAQGDAYGSHRKSCTC